MGAAVGFEVALGAAPDAPWGRLYLEAELGGPIVGVGAGPALLFGEQTTLGFQVTPYAAVPAKLASYQLCRVEPITVTGLFYRYTRRSGQAGLHDVGVFAKGVIYPGDDNYVDAYCIH